MVQQLEIVLPPYPRGYHLITSLIKEELPFMPETGMINLFLKHTSAGLTVNENVDPSVRTDFESVMNRMVKENESYYTHTLEGVDDMPAHIKASLMGSSLTIPVTNHHLNLGTWQGIYLCEFRNNGGPRRIVVTIYG